MRYNYIRTLIFLNKTRPAAEGCQPDGARPLSKSFGFWSKRDCATPPRLAGAALVIVAIFIGGARPASAQHPLAPPAATLAPVAAPVVLASHRAVYNVTLVRASQADGVRSAFGSTTYTLTDRCDGYTIESALQLELGLSNGSESAIEQRYAAWEAKDNRSASFRMLTHENGDLKDSYHGTATLDATGAGSVTYADDQQDQPTTFNLPAGTLLSTGHIIALLTSAARGETLVNRSVIDGSFDDGPYRIAAVIGPQAHEVLPAADSGGLETGVLRPVALAYFSLQSTEDAPQYELTMSLYPNGVARHMVQDFGGFTLAFDLVHVEPIAKPPC